MRSILFSLVVVVFASACQQAGAAHAESAVAPLPEDEYTIDLAAKGPYAAGRRGSVAITVAARKGYHVNPDYPATFKPEGAEALKFAEERIKLTAGKNTPCAENAQVACAVEFPVAFTAERRGPARFAGMLAFSVCTPKVCLIRKVPLTLALNVDIE